MEDDIHTARERGWKWNAAVLILQTILKLGCRILALSARVRYLKFHQGLPKRVG